MFDKSSGSTSDQISEAYSKAEEALQTYRSACLDPEVDKDGLKQAATKAILALIEYSGQLYEMGQVLTELLDPASKPGKRS